MKFFILFFTLIITLPAFSQETKLELSKIRGKEIYSNYCITCHQENGEGVVGVFPPLASSDFLLENNEKAIRAIIFGENAELVVNNVTYFGEMPPQDLTDQQIADVMNYILNSWGNQGEAINLEKINEIKNE